MSEVYRGIWVIAYRELLRFWEDRARMISSFMMPLLFLVIFGAGFNRTIGAMVPGIDFIKFMYPGIVAMTVLSNSLFAGISIVWDREFGFLREVLVAPISRTGVVLGKALGAAAIALAQGIVMLVLAPVVGVSLTPMLVVKLMPLLVLLSLAVSGVGIFIAARMRSQQAFQVVTQVLLFPLMFTAGIFFPVNNVPVWLEVIAKVNPVTYGVDAVRQLFLSKELAAMAEAPGGGAGVLRVTVFGHQMTMVEDVLVVAIMCAVLTFAAAWAFSRQE